MTAQDIIDLCCNIDFFNISIIVWTFLVLIAVVPCYLLFQEYLDEKREFSYNNKSITKLYSQFLERSEVFGLFYPPDLDSYEEYLITFKGWTAQEVYQKIKEHLESIIEEYKNTGKYDESDNHALANFLAEINFASGELHKFESQKKRQKIDTKLSNFS